MMTPRRLPLLEPGAIMPTRNALHAYSRVLGDWLKSARPRRKHWWHASLRPSLRGLSTGVVRANVDFELELDFAASALHVRTERSDATVVLAGQSADDLASWLKNTLTGTGVDVALAPSDVQTDSDGHSGYSRQRAAELHAAFASIASAMEDLRSGIREETSPIQVWPHHFDLSMLWLPGSRIPGQDPADEEHSDKQMNFGFAFGDEGIPSPYFYVTAYPLPEPLPKTKLPTGTTWRSEGFSGAVLLYEDLVKASDPSAYLQDLWTRMLEAARAHMANDD